MISDRIDHHFSRPRISWNKFLVINVVSNVISTKNQQLEMIDKKISTKCSCRAKCSSFLDIRRL